MAQRLVLHIGLMKSGTSFVQRRLGSNSTRFAEHGVLFPGRGWNVQVLAVGEVLNRKRRGPGQREGAWQRLVDEITAWNDTAVVSMEFLGPVLPKKIRLVLDSFPDTDVHVVATVRDLNRNIPAMWQETLKNSRSWTWPDYVEGVRTREGSGKLFWREQDAVRITRQWMAEVGRDRFALVTVPPPGAPPDTLWERFCAAAELSLPEAAPEPPVNESLGAASAQVMRRLNERLAELGVESPDYTRFVKHGLAKGVLAGHRGEEDPIGLAVSPWVEELSEQMRRDLAALDPRVFGDLSDLRPVEAPGVDPEQVSDPAMLDAALTGLTGLLMRVIAGRPGGQPGDDA